MDLERLIIQNIQRDKLQESLDVEEVTPEVEPSTEHLLDLLKDFATMCEKGYHYYPEGTSENKAYRQLEDEIIKYKLSPRSKAPTVKNPEMPGSFEDLSKVGTIK